MSELENALKRGTQLEAAVFIDMVFWCIKNFRRCLKIEKMAAQLSSYRVHRIE